VKVELLNGGWITSRAGIWRRGESLERDIRFPIPAYVIEAGGERILVDTGLHPDAVARRRERYGDEAALGPVALELPASVAEQVEPETLTRVVLTHLHYDHAGGLALLPPALPVVVQRREWEAAHDPAATVRNYFHAVDVAPLADRVVLVDGDCDLLPDGSVRLLLTPGHTPGHQSVCVGERLVIGGDVCHFASGFDDHRFPVFGDDFEAQAASAERLRGLRDAGLTVLPGHDGDVLRPGRLL
jgi:glyoxylase-like metal-dependent hydrolase (beta-lactamase superfamily II)